MERKSDQDPAKPGCSGVVQSKDKDEKETSETVMNAEVQQTERVDAAELQQTPTEEEIANEALNSLPILYSNSDISPELQEIIDEPLDKCPICLDDINDKAKPDSCKHNFCFACLKRWSEANTKCPLCKADYKTIHYNYREGNLYDKYRLKITHYLESLSVILTHLRTLDSFTEMSAFNKKENLDYLVFWLWYVGDFDSDFFARLGYPDYTTPHSPVQMRRCVYRRRLWVLPPPLDDLRTATPAVYRRNVDELKRLEIWIRREMGVLLTDLSLLEMVVAEVLSWIQTYHIMGRIFYVLVDQFLKSRTRQFIHELYCFAVSTITEMSSYDNTVIYINKRRSKRKLDNGINITQVENSCPWGDPVLDYIIDTQENLAERQDDFQEFDMATSVFRRFRPINYSFGPGLQIQEMVDFETDEEDKEEEEEGVDGNDDDDENNDDDNDDDDDDDDDDNEDDDDEDDDDEDDDKDDEDEDDEDEEEEEEEYDDND